MCKLCNCKERFNVTKDGIFFGIGFGIYYTELECIYCGAKKTVNNRTFRDCENIYLIDITNTMFSKEIYKSEIDAIRKVLNNTNYIYSNYKIFAEIIQHIFKIYNKEYYDLYYKYKFKKVREKVISLVVEKHRTTGSGYNYADLIEKLNDSFKDIKSDFDIVDFLENYSKLDEEEKKVFDYGPCSCGMYTVVDEVKIVESLNSKFLQKIEYRKNADKIVSDILALQDKISSKFEKYIRRLSSYGEFGFESFLKQCDNNESSNKSFLEEFLCYIKNDKKIPDKNKIIIEGIKHVLKDVVETKYFFEGDITCENHIELLSTLQHNNEILEKYI